MPFALPIATCPISSTVRNSPGSRTINSFDPVLKLPAGNVTLREAREKLGPRIAIVASLTQFLSPIHEWGWVRGRVGEMLEGTAPGDPLILNVAADPQATMADTQRLVDECRRVQR